jgi:hypothetical protein
MVLEAAGSAEPPVQLEATWLVPQADTLIVHQLAASAPFVSSVRAV